MNLHLYIQFFSRFIQLETEFPQFYCIKRERRVKESSERGRVASENMRERGTSTQFAIEHK